MSSIKNSKWYFVVGGLAVLALVTAVIVSVIPAAFARSGQASDGSLPRSVTAVGIGSASAAPDVATAQIGVDTQAASPEEATREHDTRMQTLIDALKAAGIDATDIQTAHYNLYAEQRYRPETGEPTGEFTYRVSSSVSVKIRDLAKVGEILSDAVKAGANSIGGVFFNIENTSALEAAAREKAVADAKARAQSLAQLSGVELGELTLVSEFAGPAFYERGVPAVGGGGDAPFVPGQLEVSMQVQVSFAIK